MNTHKFIFATAILLFCTLSASAYDFAVDGLYYNVIHGTKNVKVTSSGKYPNSYMLFRAQFRGR